MWSKIINVLGIGISVGTIVSMFKTQEHITEAVAEEKVKSIKSAIFKAKNGEEVKALHSNTSRLIKNRFVDSSFNKDDNYWRRLSEVVQAIPNDLDITKCPVETKESLVVKLRKILPPTGINELIIFKQEIGLGLSEQELNMLKK